MEELPTYQELLSAYNKLLMENSLPEVARNAPVTSHVSGWRNGACGERTGARPTPLEWAGGT